MRLQSYWQVDHPHLEAIRDEAPSCGICEVFEFSRVLEFILRGDGSTAREPPRHAKNLHQNRIIDLDDLSFIITSSPAVDTSCMSKAQRVQQ